MSRIDMDKHEVDVGSHEITCCLHSEMFIITLLEKNHLVKKKLEFGTLSVQNRIHCRLEQHFVRSRNIF